MAPASYHGGRDHSTLFDLRLQFDSRARSLFLTARHPVSSAGANTRSVDLVSHLAAMLGHPRLHPARYLLPRILS